MRYRSRMSFQAYLDNVERQTGKTPNDFIAEARAKGLTETKELMAWLKTDYGLGHGHANAITYVIRNGARISSKHVGTTGTHRDESDELRLDGLANR